MTKTIVIVKSEATANKIVTKLNETWAVKFTVSQTATGLFAVSSNKALSESTLYTMNAVVDTVLARCGADRF